MDEILDLDTIAGFWPHRPADISVSRLLEMMDQHGVSRACIVSARGILYDDADGNTETLAWCRTQPRLIPVGTLDLRKFVGFGYVSINFNYPKESFEELEHYLGRRDVLPQFVGVKVHPLLAKHRYDTPEGMKLTRAVADYGVPILVHTLSSSLESPWNVLPAAEANPGVPIILGENAKRLFTLP